MGRPDTVNQGDISYLGKRGADPACFAANWKCGACGAESDQDIQAKTKDDVLEAAKLALAAHYRADHGWVEDETLR